jgi:anti-sigma factor RsiW
MKADLERRVGGLRCREVLALLEEYMDGTLGAGELAAVEGHVRECEQCAAFGAAYAGVIEEMKKAPRADGLDPAVARRLEERLRLERG